MSIEATTSDDPELSPNSLKANAWRPSLLACSIACIASCIVGALLLHMFSPIFALTYTKELGLSPSAEEIRKYREAIHLYWVSNYSSDFAILGALLGLCIGFATATTRKAFAALAAALCGGAIGAIGAYVASGYVVQSILSSSDQSLRLAVVLNGSIWGGLFGAIIFAVALTQSNVASAISGFLVGVLSGFAGAIAYLVVFSLAFPKADLTHLVPDTGLEKGIWAMIYALVLGVGLYTATRQDSSRKIASVPEHEHGNP